MKIETFNYENILADLSYRHIFYMEESPDTKEYS